MLAAKVQPGLDRMSRNFSRATDMRGILYRLRAHWL